MPKKYSIEMTKADWRNIAHLIGDTDCIGIYGHDVEPYESADAFVAAVKSLLKEQTNV